MATTKYSALTGVPVVLPNYEPWTNVSVTNTLTTNVTTTAKRKVSFEEAEYDIFVSFSGVNTQGVLAISLPTGDVIDDALFASQASNVLDPIISNVTINDANGVARGVGRVHLNTTSQLRIYCIEAVQGASAGVILPAYANLIDTSANRPITFASGDSISIRFRVPLTRLAGGMTAYGAGRATAVTPGLVSQEDSGTHVTNVSGPFATNSITIQVSKVGRTVTLTLPDIMFSGNSTAAPISFASALPAKWQPVAGGSSFTIRARSSSTYQLGLLNISAAGVISAYYDPAAANFPATANPTGMPLVSVSYVSAS